MVKFTETAFLGALATEIWPDLGDLEREGEGAFVLYDVASEWHGMIEAESLIGTVGGFGSLDYSINLLFGVAAGFG